MGQRRRNLHITDASKRADAGSKDATALNSVGEPRDKSEDHSAYGIRRDCEELRTGVRYEMISERRVR